MRKTAQFRLLLTLFLALAAPLALAQRFATGQEVMDAMAAPAGVKKSGTLPATPSSMLARRTFQGQ